MVCCAWIRGRHSSWSCLRVATVPSGGCRCRRLGADQLGGYTYRFTRSERFVKICMGICNVFYYGVFLAGLAGLARLFRSRALGAGLLLPLYFLGLTLAHMLVEVADRYHYSLIPILIIFAALGFAGEERSQL